ncbi:Kinase suppressor of Ras 2 [Taenia crassiceps]|uniref:Kinase suppressor of Ras 2 n=1 Tax=Taenia crassiceps TaxID=6207 RepID=A0ABR4QTP9_9CEST
MSAPRADNGCKTSLQYCTDLQSLINITLDYVLTPLRKELKKSNDYLDILNLEIQDGENKTFEYIAQQISEICNAEEDVADSILVKYPSSISCFRCLGIDEDTINGLLYLRDITFLKLLDMPENEVMDVLKDYSVSQEDSDRILMGLSKIRSNIDLLESDQPFEDDTRNLIKQVIKLTERSESSPEFERPDGSILLHCDPLSSPPLYVTGPQDFEEGPCFASTNDSNTAFISRRALRSGRFSSDQSGEIEYFNEVLSPPIPSLRSGAESHPSSCFSINPPNLQFSFNHPAYVMDLTTQTLNRNSRRAKTPVPFQRFYRALSPGTHRTNSTNIKASIFDGGLSVPSTPAPRVFGTPVHQKSPSRGALMSASYTGTNDSPPQPPHSPCSLFQRNTTPRERGLKMPTTPPSKHRIKFTFPLHRSKSHESNLACRVYPPLVTTATTAFANGLLKGGHATPKSTAKLTNLHTTSESHSPTVNDSNVFCFPTPTHLGAVAPVSPKCTSRSERQPNLIHHSGRLAVPLNANGSAGLLPFPGHTHRFESEAKFTDFVRRTPCAVCNGRLTLRFPHCVYCNMKTHKNCVAIASKMPCPGVARPCDSADVHRNSVGAVRITANTSGLNNLTGSDCSNSASSCNSCSTPGSPFQVDFVGGKLLQNNGNSFNLSHISSIDHPPTAPLNDQLPEDFQDNQATSTELQAPSRILSSCESSRTVVEGRLSRLESVESQDDHSAFTRTNSMSVTLKEWNIPLQNLQLGEMIGRGVIGTVYRGKWHGEVAVKKIDILNDNDDNGASFLNSFKREVATLPKLRHENLVLFMGACTKPPDLAIVTQLSKGESLHYLLHMRKHSLSTNRIISIASQIAKGMGYLHARQIVHRDLKTRNIFIETNYKAVIADFALFNFVNFCKLAKCGNYVHIPPNWLCYVAPEIMRALNIGNPANELPFTPESDVFAFGTVWYELLACEYPFRGLPTETLVYLVGTGIKPPLKLQCPRDFKEMMRQCWSYHPQDRPEFTTLVKQLDRLPKLHRSPSYPTKPHSAFATVSSSAASTSSNAANCTTSSIVGGGGSGGGGARGGGGGARISGNRLILPLLLVP